MHALNLETLNLKAPYLVECQNESDYTFKTDFGVNCIVSFMDDYAIWQEGAYQFIIGNENNTSSPNDYKLRDTIICIIEAFFEANPDILLYVCETGDGKEAFRNRLFMRWMNEYIGKESFIVDHFEIKAEGVTNFAAIIIQRSNPDAVAIINEFHEYLEVLRKPEE